VLVIIGLAGQSSHRRLPLSSNVRPQKARPVADPIFYTRVEFLAPSPLMASVSVGTPTRYIAHLYLQVEDEVYASAWASDFCTDNGYEFKEFLSLPVVMNKTKIREYEPEHQSAYALALERGHGSVISIVFAPESDLANR
jgi:hypothetical protein